MFNPTDILLGFLRAFIIAELCTLIFGSSPVASWQREPSVANFQVTSGRISTMDVDSLQRCMTECYIKPGCVTVGYSDNYEGCQLYSLDLTDFVQNQISQPATSFFKAVCPKDGYTHVRPLGLCVRRSTTIQLPQRNATAICATEGASLMKVDLPTKGDYLRDILFHIHDPAVGFEYLIGGKWNASSWEWEDGTPIDENNGKMYWLSGVPDNTSGDCLSIKRFGDAVGFEPKDCSTNMMYFCSYVLN